VVGILKTIFAQETKETVLRQWQQVTQAVSPRFHKLGELIDRSRDDVPAYMAFTREHSPLLASTIPLERLNGELNRRSDVIGIYPNDRTIIGFVGALTHEQSDEWAVARRYITLETLNPMSDDPMISLHAVVV
jgi:putative transposase